MDREANYVAVGAFVLLVIVMAVSFIFWYTGREDKRTYQTYEIYFNGSVSGLSVGSPVRYLGVDIGKVDKISLDPRERTRVQVIVDVDSTTPIDSGTKAALSLQGVTGLLFIDLEEDPRAAPGGALQSGQRYPIIGSGKSSIDVLLSSLPALTTHMIELVDRLNQVFSDENVRTFKLTIDNAKAASERLPGTVKDLQALLGDARQVTEEVQGTVKDLHGIVSRAAPNIDAAVANVRQVSETLERTSDRLDKFVADNEPGLSRFTRQSLPEFEQLLRESRQAARDFRDLSRSLKANPSQLIYESSFRGVQVPQ